MTADIGSLVEGVAIAIGVAAVIPSITNLASYTFAKLDSDFFKSNADAKNYFENHSYFFRLAGPLSKPGFVLKAADKIFAYTGRYLGVRKYLKSDSNFQKF